MLRLLPALALLAGCPAADPCALVGGDSDGDGFCDVIDTCPAVADPDQADADGDGRGDACDPVDGGLACDGRGHDNDGDGVCSAYDRCPDLADPDQRDQDQDGLGDACDPTPLPCDDRGGDADADRVCDELDNCPGLANPTQVDLDLDGVGDHCDPTPPPSDGAAACYGVGGDFDGDGVCNLVDRCPTVHDPLQSDRDQDGVGDACDDETCDGLDNDGDGEIDEDFPDEDGDGIAGCVDPCRFLSQHDTDGDGLPECSDPCPDDPLNDDDGDGSCASWDLCPGFYNPTHRDADGDGIGDECDVEACDGLDNDGDRDEDEGLPDADGDGQCDEIDPCPLDPGDDWDGDGLCGDVDVCPDHPDPDQEDADGNGFGDACDPFDALDCADPAPLTPGAPIPNALRVGHVAGRLGDDLIYVSLRADSPTWPNEVAAIDTTTRTVRWHTWVGYDPGRLALAHDSSLLYVELTGTGSLRVVQPDARRACDYVDLPGASYHDLLTIEDLQVAPGAPELISVLVRRAGTYGTPEPVRVLRAGAALTIDDSPLSGGTAVGFAFVDATHAWALDASSRLSAVAIDGPFARVGPGRAVSVFDAPIVAVDDLLLTRFGQLIDPAAPRTLGWPGGTGSVANAAAREVYTFEYPSTLHVVSLDTLLRTRSLSVGSHSTAVWLALYGEGGVAMVSEGKLRFLDAP